MPQQEELKQQISGSDSPAATPIIQVSADSKSTLKLDNESSASTTLQGREDGNTSRCQLAITSFAAESSQANDLCADEPITEVNEQMSLGESIQDASIVKTSENGVPFCELPVMPPPALDARQLVKEPSDKTEVDNKDSSSQDAFANNSDHASTYERMISTASIRIVSQADQITADKPCREVNVQDSLLSSTQGAGAHEIVGSPLVPEQVLTSHEPRPASEALNSVSAAESGMELNRKD